jgi:RNA polymerase sigma-70 factor (ECF subfamily)
MLGELGEAEDIVQEVWLRWDAVDRSEIRNTEAFLVAVTTRLAVDRLRSAQHRRETYVGPWLPEPLVADADGSPDDPERKAIEAERLNLALLGALERLNPVERAVLILRDAFDLEYAEIADVVDRSPANVRQIATRARAHAGDQSRTRPVSAEEQERLATAFMAAALAGDIDEIRAALAADAILYSDGGGVVTAARKPIYGADKIARFLVGVQRKPAFVPDIEYTLVRVNGDLGVRMVSPTSGFLAITAVQVQGGEIVAVRIFSNPERFG